MLAFLSKLSTVGWLNILDVDCAILIVCDLFVSGVNCANFIDNCSPIFGVDSLMVMFTEQDLVKGKDTMVPIVGFQEKKRTGWRQLKISSSGVVQYLSNTCYTNINSLPNICLLIQVILLGDC
jgi:hypothetical protein